MVISDVYNDNYQLMIGMRQSGIPIPEAYIHMVQMVINKQLRSFFEEESFLHVRELKQILSEFERWDISISEEKSFKLIASERIHRELRNLKEAEVSIKTLENFTNILQVLSEMDLDFDLWKSQNLYFSLLKGYKNGEWVFANDQWKALFLELGDHLKVRV